MLTNVSADASSLAHQNATSSTCESITSRTEPSSALLPNSDRHETPPTDFDTQSTQNIERRKKRKSNAIASADLTCDLQGNSRNTDSRHPITLPCSPYKADDAPSAEAKAETDADTDFTSTIATPPDKSVDFCADLAISESESSETVPSYFQPPQCTCGLSGKRILITKPKILGWGLNFQHCHNVIVFPSHSFEQYYQLVRRCYRFGQTHPVTVSVIVCEGERGVLKSIARKQDQADQMFSSIVSHMKDAMHLVTSDYFPESERVPSWLS
jgi:hypothetical protein